MSIFSFFKKKKQTTEHPFNSLLAQAFPNFLNGSTNDFDIFDAGKLIYYHVLPDGKLLRDVFNIVADFGYHSSSFKCMFRTIEPVKFMIDYNFEEYDLFTAFNEATPLTIASSFVTKPIWTTTVYGISDVSTFLSGIDDFYSGLEKLRDRMKTDHLGNPMLSKITFTRRSGFQLYALVNPSRVDSLVDRQKMEYADAYRQYLIDKLAEASITEKYYQDNQRKIVVGDISYDQPKVEVKWYKDFESDHIKELNIQALNDKYKGVIEEVRSAAEKLLPKT